MMTFIVRMIIIFFFLFVFGLPGIDHDLLVIRSEIYRLPDSQCIIEFVDILSGNIVLTTSREVSLHHI